MSEASITSELKKRKRVDVYEDLDPEVKERSKKMLFYLIIFSVIMLFGGFTSAYIVMQPRGFWVVPEPVMALTMSCVIVAVSSVFLLFSGYFARRDDRSMTTIFLVLTLISGFAFLGSQWVGFKSLNEKGFFMAFNKIGQISGEYGADYKVTHMGVPLVHENGQFYMANDELQTSPVTDFVKQQNDNSTSLMFLFIIVHAFHLVLGMIYLIVNVIRSIKGTFSGGNVLSIRTQGIYWHFMGILWLYLYAFLFIIY